jgi:Methylamine utilisation protein MauE
MLRVFERASHEAVGYHGVLMIDPALGALLAGAFALLFASAALHKLLDPERFGAAFRAYEVVPSSLGWLSRLLPLLELAVALALLATRSRHGAAAAGAALLLLYAAAIALNLHRGRRDLDCGCSGPSERRPIGTWMIWRNLLLAALLAMVLLPWAARPLSGTDALTIGAGTVVAALLYLSVDALLAQPRPRLQRLEGG